MLKTKKYAKINATKQVNIKTGLMQIKMHSIEQEGDIKTIKARET